MKLSTRYALFLLSPVVVAFFFVIYYFLVAPATSLVEHDDSPDILLTGVATGSSSSSSSISAPPSWKEEKAALVPRSTVVLSTPAAAAVPTSPPANVAFSPQFLLMDFAPPRTMGLTNQLISYSEALFLASLSNRTLVLPISPFPPVEDILDLQKTEASLFELTGLRVRILTYKQFLQIRPQQQQQQQRETRLPTKPPKIRLPSRTTILRGGKSVADAREKLENAFVRMRNNSVVRCGNVFWHVPFVHDDGSKPAALLSALEFSTSVRDEAERILQQTRFGGEKPHVAFHARFEPDVVGFSSEFAVPAAQRLSKFLKQCVIPKVPLPASAPILFVACGNSLAKSLKDVIRESFSSAGYRVVFRPSSHLMKQGARDVTNHTDAAVDAIIARHAASVIGAEYSTFSRALQIDSCVRGRPMRLETYDHKLTRLDGSHRCEGEVLQSPFATSPHFYVPGFVASEKSHCKDL